MTRPRLPRRLRGLLDLIPRAESVADIGAGHGALAACLAAAGCPRVIATESAPGPFAELCRNLAAWRAAVEARAGRDLQPLAPGEVEGVIAAGMGARTLLRICEGAPGRGVAWIALQCVQDPELVDPWLRRHGWPVLAHAEVIDRRHRYPTWVVEVRG